MVISRFCHWFVSTAFTILCCESPMAISWISNEIPRRVGNPGWILKSQIMLSVCLSHLLTYPVGPISTQPTNIFKMDNLFHLWPTSLVLAQNGPFWSRHFIKDCFKGILMIYLTGTGHLPAVITHLKKIRN